MRSAALALLGLVLLIAGCKERTADLVRVRGTVTVNGAPLRSGTIVFAPNEQRGNHGPQSFAILDQNGAFDLMTDAGPGAKAGWHRATIAPPPDSQDLILALEKYRHPDMSGLEYQVKAGQENVFSIQITHNWGQ